jgi:excisionase family DNA binding protein
MREDILQVIKLLLENDQSVPKEQRLKILAACRNQPVKARRLGTVKQAADILGCCPKTVERVAKRGHLHPIRHSARKIRFDLDEVEAFSNQGVKTPKGSP